MLRTLMTAIAIFVLVASDVDARGGRGGGGRGGGFGGGGRGGYGGGGAVTVVAAPVMVDIAATVAVLR